MFPFQVSSSYFDPETSIPEMPSFSLSYTESASAFSDSTISTLSSSAFDSTVSSTIKCQQGLMAANSFSPDYQLATLISLIKHVHKPPTCYFDPSTCKRQNFSIPEKIVYYVAKNVTNANTYQKLVETCKYFFKVNPVIVVSSLLCNDDKWYSYYDEDGKYRVEFKYDRAINFKIWVTHRFRSFFGDASQLIPLIYKNDANVVELRGEPLKFEDFLFLAGHAKELFMWSQMVKFENGVMVQLEDIVKNVPTLKSFTFEYDGTGVNSNTVKKLMGIEHFKNISQLAFYDVTEAFDVEGMFKYITENRRVYVYLCYRRDISDANKQLVQEYSRRLDKEFGCVSVIKYDRMIYGT